MSLARCRRRARFTDLLEQEFDLALWEGPRGVDVIVQVTARTVLHDDVDATRVALYKKEMRTTQTSYAYKKSQDASILGIHKSPRAGQRGGVAA